MARPRTRVALVDADERLGMKRTFGTCVSAYKNLGLVKNVSYPTFALMWGGKEISVEDATEIVTRWEGWKANVS